MVVKSQPLAESRVDFDKTWIVSNIIAWQIFRAHCHNVDVNGVRQESPR